MVRERGRVKRGRVKRGRAGRTVALEGGRGGSGEAHIETRLW